MIGRRLRVVDHAASCDCGITEALASGVAHVVRELAGVVKRV